MVPDPHAPIDGSPAAHRAQSQDDICAKHVAQATPLARPPARQCCPCACEPPTEKAQMWCLLSSATGRDACHARPASPAPNLMQTAHSCTKLGSVQRVGRKLRRSQNDMFKCCRRPGAHNPAAPRPIKHPPYRACTRPRKASRAPRSLVQRQVRCSGPAQCISLGTYARGLKVYTVARAAPQSQASRAPLARAPAAIGRPHSSTDGSRTRTRTAFCSACARPMAAPPAPPARGAPAAVHQPMWRHDSPA